MKNLIFATSVTVALGFLLVLSNTVYADVYKCQSESGHITYTDQKCLSGKSLPIEDRLTVFHDNGLRSLELQQLKQHYILQQIRQSNKHKLEIK